MSPPGEEKSRRPTPSNPTGEPWPTIWRKVTDSEVHERPAAPPNDQPGRMARWWTLTLDCGHAQRHDGVYQKRKPDPPRGTPRTRDELRDPPRRVRCGDCETAAHRGAIMGL